MPRFRLRRVYWPRRALVLADTPQPDCPCCLGQGEIEHPYGGRHGEYADSDWAPCTCWNETRQWTVLPLPRLPHRRRVHPDPWGPGGYSDEAPF